MSTDRYFGEKPKPNGENRLPIFAVASLSKSRPKDVVPEKKLSVIGSGRRDANLPLGSPQIPPFNVLFIAFEPANTPNRSKEINRKFILIKRIPRRGMP